jgi:hypothetical protein
MRKSAGLFSARFPLRERRGGRLHCPCSRRRLRNSGGRKGTSLPGLSGRVYHPLARRRRSPAEPLQRRLRLPGQGGVRRPVTNLSQYLVGARHSAFVASPGPAQSRCISPLHDKGTSRRRLQLPAARVGPTCTAARRPAQSDHQEANPSHVGPSTCRSRPGKQSCVVAIGFGHRTPGQTVSARKSRRTSRRNGGYLTDAACLSSR